MIPNGQKAGFQVFPPTPRTTKARELVVSYIFYHSTWFLPAIASSERALILILSTREPRLSYVPREVLGTGHTRSRHFRKILLAWSADGFPAQSAKAQRATLGAYSPHSGKPSGCPKPLMFAPSFPPGVITAYPNPPATSSESGASCGLCALLVTQKSNWPKIVLSN